MRTLMIVTAAAATVLLRAGTAQASGTRENLEAALGDAELAEAAAHAGRTSCPEGMVYETCGTACPKTCGKPVSEICTMQCVLGCFCEDPDAWYDAASDRCVPEIECTQAAQNDDDLGDADNHACPDGMEHTMCGSACAKTCGRPEDDFCTAECLEGCFCKDANHWYDPATNSCVQEEDCSPTNSDQ